MLHIGIPAIAVEVFYLHCLHDEQRSQIADPSRLTDSTVTDASMEPEASHVVLPCRRASTLSTMKSGAILK